MWSPINCHLHRLIRRAVRAMLVLGLATSLGACGFKLRTGDSRFVWPATVPTMVLRVEAADANSEFVHIVRDHLAYRHGLQWVDGGAPVLHLAYKIERRLLSVDSAGRVVAYTLRFTVMAHVREGDKIRLEEFVIRAETVQRISATAVLSDERVRSRLQLELYRDVARRLARRLAAGLG